MTDYKLKAEILQLRAHVAALSAENKSLKADEMQDDEDLTRRDNLALSDLGELSQPATGLLGRRLPDWEDIAEVVRMPHALDITVTLLNGELVEMTSDDLRVILNKAGIGLTSRPSSSRTTPAGEGR